MQHASDPALVDNSHVAFRVDLQLVFYHYESPLLGLYWKMEIVNIKIIKISCRCSKLSSTLEGVSRERMTIERSSDTYIQRVR
jgi:hypothetical protein